MVGFAGTLLPSSKAQARVCIADTRSMCCAAERCRTRAATRDEGKRSSCGNTYTRAAVLVEVSATGNICLVWPHVALAPLGWHS
jgi:hypothetical protein